MSVGLVHEGATVDSSSYYNDVRDSNPGQAPCMPMNQDEKMSNRVYGCYN